MTTITEVAAAVLLRGNATAPEFLLAQRPPGKVYAGYWEFPGGKVEPGETLYQALVRELQEELGITVDDVWPWLCCEFTYPHASVRLRFYRIHAWHGEIAPIEHSAFAWLKIGEPAGVEPILPANGPILQALELPPVYALSNAEENGVEAELQRIERALAGGLHLLQLRDKTLAPAQRLAFARAVMALAGGAAKACVLINDDQELARTVGAHGLTSRRSSSGSSTADRISRASPPPATAPPILRGRRNSGWTSSFSVRCCPPPATPARPASAGRSSRASSNARRYRYTRLAGCSRRCSKLLVTPGHTASR